MQNIAGKKRARQKDLGFEYLFDNAKREMPKIVNLEIILRDYLVDSLRGRASVSGHSARARFPKSGCLFPASIGKSGKLSRRPLVRTDAADMLKRRLKQAGLPAHYSPHSFRATGITNFLENEGTRVRDCTNGQSFMHRCWLNSP
jgi:site-specific recombinase XerD